MLDSLPEGAHIPYYTPFYTILPFTTLYSIIFFSALYQMSATQILEQLSLQAV